MVLMTRKITLFLTLLCVCCFASAADYLTFTAEEDSSTVKILSNEDYREALDGPRIVVTDDTIYEYVGDSIIIEANKPDLQYSIDGGLSWDTLAIGSTIMLENKGDKVQLRGNNPAGFSKNNEIRSYFSMTGSIAASGNVMSLIDVTCESVTIPNAYCFYALFKNCTSLTQAPDLPATALTRSCYMKMFNGCTNLTQVPDLPATRLAKGCCKDMFSGCTSLTKAPKLLATTLAKNCYYEMFMNCTGLTQVPDLSATELANGCYQYMFIGCTGLTQAPKLPATTLADSCYFGMFKGCGSLTQTSDLPATELVSSCYEDMFNDCTGLTQAPKLPATKLAKNCYREMFIGCTSLTKMPELPATTLVSRCYEGMFYKCTSLTQTSELPATKLAIYCYTNMFSGCSSLTQAPDLPATALAGGCYNEMFSNCTNLTQAPELFATEVADYFCLNNMFKSCKKLSEITVHFSSWWDVDELLGITTNWVEGVASTGTFICPKELPEEYGTDRIPAGWTVKYLEESESAVDYLTFTAEEDNSSFYPELKPYVEENTGFAENPPSIQYSLDGGVTWTDFQFPKDEPVVLAKKGDKALLRGQNPWGISPEYQHYVQFVMTGSIAASGNVQTLVDTTGELQVARSFEYLFMDCTSLTKAPDLPATVLIENCYYAMFSGCTNLTQAPEVLPATQAVFGSYNRMFEGCTSLTKSPELFASPGSEDCDDSYSNMFKGCTNLSEITVHFTEWPDNYDWVKGVAPTGTFICPKELSVEYGSKRIPEGWALETGELSGMDDLSSVGFTFWTEDHTIFVRGAEGLVAVYNLNGQLLRAAQCTADGTARFVMPAAGVYVVKAGMKSVEVIVGR